MSDMPVYQVDLTNCDREPIHILGNIQPFGFLVAVGSDWVITRISANIEQFIGKAPHGLIGMPLSSIFRDSAIHNLRNRLALLRGPDAVERLLGETLLEDGSRFDIAVHFSGESIIIEAEPAAEDAGDAGGLVRTLMSRLAQTDSLIAFLREGARQVKAITGFDRVKVYRFDEEGSGEVIAEALSPGVDSFLGLHYPASDIPAQARRLYVRNIFRIIADINATPVPIIPGLDENGQPLDQSLSILRAVSPIHIEYLRNMGVSASLSISIVVNGRLWGLFACHHYSPIQPSLAIRTAAELFGQMFSLMLESRERAEASDYENRARSATDRVMAAVAKNSDLLADGQWIGEVVLDTIPADGVAVHIGGKTTLSGLTPTEDQTGNVLAMLHEASSNQIFATESLSTLVPEAAEYADIAAGILAIPLSRQPRDFVILFRSEQLRSVRWAGNQEKATEYGPNGPRLTPRKSFEAWSELVKGRSRPFSVSERRVAEGLRVAMLEVLVRLSDEAGLERQRASERQELLIAELNHRVRNILSLIRGLISQSRDRDDSVEAFVANLEGRIQALARAHDQVTKDRWRPGHLAALIETEASAYLGLKSTRLSFDGPNVLLQPVAFTTLALVFHELMTNAVKYGALSDGGTISISWHLDDEGSLLLDWAESGGPPVQAPTRRGFGSTIIEKAIPHDLGGAAEIHYQLEGLRVHLCVPSRHVAGVDRIVHRAGAGADQTAALKPLAGKTGVLLEDSMIIALDAEDALRLLGAQQVVVFASARPALKYLETEAVDFAVLDFNLGIETSENVAVKLREAGVPFVFATGYGEGISSDRLAGAPVVTKPYGADELARAFASIDATQGSAKT
ncbi:MAG: GAF domain-containing protein [Sphingobium sp.]|nr:GAF domain-containing protein [Sphingobium sp.]